MCPVLSRVRALEGRMRGACAVVGSDGEAEGDAVSTDCTCVRMSLSSRVRVLTIAIRVCGVNLGILLLDEEFCRMQVSMQARVVQGRLAVAVAHVDISTLGVQPPRHVHLPMCTREV